MQSLLDTGLAHAKATEEYVFERMKGDYALQSVIATRESLPCQAAQMCNLCAMHAVGVEVAMENPTASYGTLGAATLLLLPGASIRAPERA